MFCISNSPEINEDKYWLIFQDSMNSWCSCSLETEDTSYYLLHCHHFSDLHAVVKNSVKSICDNFDSTSDNVKEDLLLQDDSQLDENKNKVILKAITKYINNTERFSQSLFDKYFITE